MKRLILSVFTLLLGISTWAQNTGLRADCNIQIKHEVTAPSCMDGMNGRIVLKVIGAKSPYTTEWADGGTGDILEGVSAGLYIATVRDAKGCFKRYELQVPQGKALQGELAILPKTSSGSTHLSVLFSNGSKPASIQIKNLTQGVQAPWKPYQGESLSKGLYLLEAFTAAGCSKIGKIDLRAQQ